MPTRIICGIYLPSREVRQICERNEVSMGCILSRDHEGPHIASGSLGIVLWERDYACGCCEADECDCFTFSKAKGSDVRKILEEEMQRPLPVVRDT